MLDTAFPKRLILFRPTYGGLAHLAWFLVLLGPQASPTPAADIEREPINYSKAPVDNVVSRLEKKLAAGQVKLTYEDKGGWLPSLLRELRVPVSSQTLVFSKTSLQRERITPRTPRALYFNEEVYVGYCQQGSVMEVMALDPLLGSVFYTLDQENTKQPRFVRQNDTCLICHASSQNQGLPGPMIRSVFTDPRGYPILSSGSYYTGTSSPLPQRWGGWYVTGTSGKQTHLGNLLVQGGQTPEEIVNTAGTNVTDLGKWCSTAPYLSPHSDIVALMVLEHQAEVHNLLTRANLLTRVALYEEADINKALGRPADYRSESTTSRIRYAGEPLVKGLLFCDEAKLTDQVRGTSRFTDEFSGPGPRDGQGRSLYQLDLEKRLFKYPCSYLIYSPVFDALPGPVKDYVWQRVRDILDGKETGADFAHLSAADRRAILKILRATKPNLPHSF